MSYMKQEIKEHDYDMDEAAKRKGRFEIKKGLGWIKETDKFVEDQFRDYDKKIQGLLKKYLRKRKCSIKELFDIKDKIVGRSKENKAIDKDKLNELLSSFVPYFNTDDINNHEKNCKDYDDKLRQSR